MSLSPQTRLSSGAMQMPIIGLGTFQATPEEIDIALNAAIDAGYRHIDTAYLYLNEKAIGDSLKKMFAQGKVKREDVFIVTKLPLNANRPEFVEEYLGRSLEALQLSYVDLYLIHNPVGLVNRGEDFFPRDENGELLLDMETDHVALWKAMEAQVEAGRAKSIGVSNFNMRQVKRLLDNCRIPPANNQVELHIYLQQRELVSFCKENNVTICAYAPLGSPGFMELIKTHTPDEPKSVQNPIVPLEEQIVKEIAIKHNKTPAQVLLRFLIQYGVAVIPKSVNPERIRQNINIFDFELSEEEFVRIKSLDQGKSGRLFSNNIDFLRSMSRHPECPFDD